MRSNNGRIANRIQRLESEVRPYKADDEVIIVDVDVDGTTHYGDMTFKDYKSFEKWLDRQPSLQPSDIIIDDLNFEED